MFRDLRLPRNGLRIKCNPQSLAVVLRTFRKTTLLYEVHCFFLSLHSKRKARQRKQNIVTRVGVRGKRIIMHMGRKKLSFQRLLLWIFVYSIFFFFHCSSFIFSLNFCFVFFRNLFRNLDHHRRLRLKLAWTLQRFHSLSLSAGCRKNLQRSSLSFW